MTFEVWLICPSQSPGEQHLRKCHRIVQQIAPSQRPEVGKLPRSHRGLWPHCLDAGMARRRRICSVTNFASCCLMLLPETKSVVPGEFASIVVVQPLSRARLFATPWTEARQASLSFTASIPWSQTGCYRGLSILEKLEFSGQEAESHKAEKTSGLVLLPIQWLSLLITVPRRGHLPSLCLSLFNTGTPPLCQKKTS